MSARRTAGRIERAVRDQLREAGLLGTGIKTPALGMSALLLASVIDRPAPVNTTCPSCEKDHDVEFPVPNSRELSALARELRMTMGAVLKEDNGGDTPDGVAGGPE